MTQMDPKENAARIRQELALRAAAEERGDVDGVATANKNLKALGRVEKAEKAEKEAEQPKRSTKPRRNADASAPSQVAD